MKKIMMLAFIALLSKMSFAQDNMPYTFINNSVYQDTEIYIGLVGKFGNNVDVWMDMDDNSLVQMSSDQNTIEGPSWSTPADWLYPDIFTKLSDVTDKTILIPRGLYGCRIFISFESPMYLRFHDTGGYAGANLNSSTDPNDGIRWEIVELTWGNSGLWTNSSRVDAYQYPIAIEVAGFTGPLIGPNYTESYSSALGGNGTPKYGKVGELLPHDEILNQWDDVVSPEYLVAKLVAEHSIDGGYIIEQPSKVEAFPEDVFDNYIDEIWETYADNYLVIDIGERGIWTGRTTGDQFDFTDPVDGSIATIYGKPSSFNAIEGSGFLAFTEADANVNREKHDEDLMIQAQMAAAINRHAIYTDVIDSTVQYTHDASTYFIEPPYNEYVSYFHDEALSYDSKTYAFAYDDVGDHSSTIQCTFPVSAKVIIGGYDQYIDPESELLFIAVSPLAQEVEIESTLQFTAQGYDQYSAPFPTNVSWSTTGGGTIGVNGLFSATTLGDYTVTAQDGNILRAVAITVVEKTEEPGITDCEGPSPNGDYRYAASNDSENPTITFIPSVVGHGDPTCLLYYKTDPNANFTDLGVSPNVPQQISASAGDTVLFYYTYSLVTGGENNTSSSLQRFLVGGCIVSSLNSPPNSAFSDLVVSPNPSMGNAVYLSGIKDDLTVDVYGVDGQWISSRSVVNEEIIRIDTSGFSAGTYVLSVTTSKGNYTKAFRFIVN